MINGILWVIKHLPWLTALVTSTITIVETVGAYVGATGAEKKQKALDMLKKTIDEHVKLPSWIETRIEALLGFMIDGVVWIMNSFFGKHWGNVTDTTTNASSSSANANVSTASALTPATLDSYGVQPNQDALAQAKADFQAIVAKNAAKTNTKTAPAPAPAAAATGQGSAGAAAASSPASPEPGAVPEQPQAPGDYPAGGGQGS